MQGVAEGAAVTAVNLLPTRTGENNLLNKMFGK